MGCSKHTWPVIQHSLMLSLSIPWTHWTAADCFLSKSLENKDLLIEQSPSVPQHPITRPPSQASAPGSDHLDAGEGLLCKLTYLQQKCVPNPALLPSSAMATAIQVTNLSLNVSAGQPIVVSVPSMTQGMLAVELPKSDLTKFITSALTER